MANVSHLQVAGRERIGKYRLIKELDDLGGARPGPTFVAEEPNTRRLVALKLLTPAAEFRTAFLEECRRLIRLDHDNIARILDSGEAEADCFVVTDLLKGESLDVRLRREHRLSLKESARIAREVAAGLAHAHANGLVHRDVCPANIWLEPHGRVKLLGFGQAPGEVAVSLLSPIDDVGTAGYLSPEQAAGEPITASSDLFSLGCVLYQMTTGERPFRGENCVALFRAVVFEHPATVRQVNPEAPAAVDELVEALMAKMPAGRPASAQEVELRLLQWLDPAAAASRAANSAEPLAIPASKRILDTLDFLKKPLSTPDRGDSNQTVLTGWTARTGLTATAPAPRRSRRKAAWFVDLIAATLLFAAAAGLYLWWRSSNDPGFWSSPPAKQPPSSIADNQ